MRSKITIAAFIIVLKCISVFCTRRPIIGILAQEFGKYKGVEHIEINEGTKTYIAASYVKAVESSGARVVPIFANRSYDYYEILHSINGVVIPGGDAEIQPSHPFYDAFTIVIKISEKINEKGIYFPILSVCLGFEAILTLYNNHKLLQTICSIRHENYPLKFEPKFTETLLFSDIDRTTYVNLKYFPITVNNHLWCTTRHNFTKSRSLSKSFKITSTSISSRGLEFIATAEHKKYPFMAVQFHPEKVIYEWAEELNLPHSKSAVQSNRYFYDVLVKLSKLNSNKFRTEEEERKALIYNYAPTYQNTKPLTFAQIYTFD